MASPIARFAAWPRASYDGGSAPKPPAASAFAMLPSLSSTSTPAFQQPVASPMALFAACSASTAALRLAKAPLPEPVASCGLHSCALKLSCKMVCQVRALIVSQVCARRTQPQFTTTRMMCAADSHDAAANQCAAQLLPLRSLHQDAAE